MIKSGSKDKIVTYDENEYDNNEYDNADYQFTNLINVFIHENSISEEQVISIETNVSRGYHGYFYRSNGESYVGIQYRIRVFYRK